MTFWQRLRFLFFGKWPTSRHVFVPGDNLMPSQAQEVRAAWLRALAVHPGFMWLMADLEEKKAMHEDRLRAHQGAAALSMKDGLDGLLRYHTAAVQAEEAVYWLGYIQHLVRRANALPAMQPRPSQVSPTTATVA